jgi:pectate lyase
MKKQHNLLKGIARLLAIACATAIAVSTSPAANITWGSAQNISADSNVSTTGTAVRAANLTASGQSLDVDVTLNGVTFARSPYVGTTTTLPNGDTLVTSDSSRVGAYQGFGGATAPFSALSTSYKNLLSSGFYNDGDTGTASTTARQTLTLRNLTVGTVYQIQVWVNDYRLNNLGQNNPDLYTTVAGGSGSVNLQHNVGNALGGIGQYVTGTFTADATTQVVTLTGGNSTVDTTSPSCSAILNAYQLRNTGGTPPPSGTSGGWADANGGVTGGSGGTAVTVTTAADLVNYAQTQTGKYIITVRGTIQLSSQLNINNNKTIVGYDSSATIDGQLDINGKANIIIQKLRITNPRNIGTSDGIRIQSSHNIWVDHCSIFTCGDGLLDNTHNTDYITISWCKFYYAADTGHNYVNLIGSSNTDSGNYRITFHHNWWSTLCKQRMPRVRFGQIHMYNNYFSCSGDDYCTSIQYDSQLLSQNNVYEGVYKPITKDQGSPKIKVSGNSYVNCTGTNDPGTDSVFTPTYSYTLDSTSNVKSLVTSGAGH